MGVMFKCPLCGEETIIPASWVGRKDTCWGCGATAYLREARPEELSKAGREQAARSAKLDRKRARVRFLTKIVNPFSKAADDLGEGLVSLIKLLGAALPIIGIAVVLAVSYCDGSNASQSGAPHEQSRSLYDSQVYNGYDWRNASRSQRMMRCEELAARFRTKADFAWVTAGWLYEALSHFYVGDEDIVLRETTADIAALAVAIRVTNAAPASP